ncbi:MAG: thioredoxin family protein [Acidimicrobiia bacterium]
MRVTVLYFEGCPNWELARNRVTEAAASVGSTVDIKVARVETLEEAEAVGFSGSPTILIDGEDPFPHPAEVALACRLYGDDHAPSVGDLVAALRKRS